MEAVIVYSTFPSVEAAEAAGRAVVAQRLAACVNILPGMVSFYLWEGRVERGEEVVLLAKTLAERADAVMAQIRALHPYDLPALMVLPLAGGDGDYLAWIAQGSTPGP